MAPDLNADYGFLRSDAASLVITSFLSIALYIVIDLNFQIFTTFKAFRSLYFWSVFIATWGIAFNAVGYLVRHHQLAPSPFITATIILIGWCTMVTGQSAVLYSRLHVILVSEKVLRAVLIMIVVDAIWLHIPVIILVYGVNSPKAHLFERPYDIYERIQLSVFFVQEVIISGIYLWQTRHLFLLERAIGNANTKRTMMHLIYVNILVILLDISVVALEFAGLFDIQTAWKPLVYGTKLKLEFSILNKLVDLLQGPKSGSSGARSRVATQNHREVELQRFGQHSLGDEVDGNRHETNFRARDERPQSQQQYRGSSSLAKRADISIHQRDTSSGDGHSLESAAAGPIGRDGQHECASSASSEVQFARRGG